MKEVFYELIREAKNGKVTYDGDIFEFGFNTKIIRDGVEEDYFNPRNLSCLMIRNEDEFFRLLETYLNLELSMKRKLPYHETEHAKIKWLISYLFANATPEDFNEPEQLIRRRIGFLKDDVLEYLDSGKEINLGEEFFNTTLCLKNEVASVAFETPYDLDITLKGNGTYHFPKIYYGIDDGVCYIYAIKNPKIKDKSEDDLKLEKKVNRLLFKLNDGVLDDEDYNREDDANIKDVTMSFVLALNIFISILEKKNIKEVKVVPYLPLRYLSRDIYAEDSVDREALEERNNRIQTNLTDKFIRTFRRLARQNPDIIIESYPYEVDENLNIKIKSKSKEIDNMLLEETSKRILESGDEECKKSL